MTLVSTFGGTDHKYTDAVKNAAQKNGLSFIDSPKIYGKLDSKSYHVEDGIHLNELGYEVFIKELAKIINS